MTTITKIDATPVSVPFARPERWAFGEHRGMSSIIVEIHTESGIVGIGEIVPGGPGPQTLLAALNELRPLLIDRDARDIEANVRRMLYSGGWYMFPRTGNLVIAGVEMAMWDILGKSLDVPVWRLFGGRLRDTVPYMYYLQAGPALDDRVAEAADAVAHGFDTIYVKGGWDEEEDVATLARLRESLEPKVNLRLDANEAWTVGTATRVFRRLEPLNLQFVEQPVRMDDLAALARLRRSTAVPVGLNQGGWTGQKIFDIARESAADVIVTDPHQEGGLTAFRRSVGLCELAGLPVVHHAFSGLTIAMTASMHVLCSSANCIYAHQAYPPGFVGEDVVVEPLDITGGRACVPNGPGLGVELDRDRLAAAARRFDVEGFYSFFDAAKSIAWMPNR